MNDTEVIKKAVELVDTCRYPWGCYKMSDVELPRDQFTLDALAAQLVRQVNKTRNYEVVISEYHCSIYDQETHDEVYCLEAMNATSDYTMNTIRAIVESGVLE